jgi:adenosine deaminase
MKTIYCNEHYFCFHRGCPKAIDRIAYEFCEDCSKHNIKYVETRYCPHLLANTADKPEYAIEKGNVSPRDVVSIVCSALEFKSYVLAKAPY